jgi:glycosyltransferase involved in cell wall biosynthesis
MILFLTDQSKGRRGGEEDNARLFEFFKANYEIVKPERLTEITGELKSPFNHANYKLRLAKKFIPDMTVLDLSTAVRNFIAIKWLKSHRKKIMTVLLGRRMNFRRNNKFVEKTVRFFENYMIRNSDIILVNSRYTAGLAGRHADKNAKIVIVLPGTTFTLTNSETIDRAGRNRQSPPRLLFVGECTRVKGLEYLIDALILKRNMDFELRIAGDYNDNDKYYRRIKRKIENGGIAARVTFLGFVRAEKLAEIYRDSSVYILPSLSEGYGRSLVEALSFGLPIIASNTGAIPELVREGANAILVEPGNPRSLSVAIEKMLSNPELMDKMSHANFEKTATMQTWDMYGDDLWKKLVPAVADVAGIYPLKKETGGADRSKQND